MSQFADRIRTAAREKSTKPFQPTGSSITSQIQSQQTGKAAPTGPTGQSNIGAQVAASAPNPLGAQAQAAGEQMAGQEQQAATQQMAQDAQADMQRKQFESQQLMQTNQILDNAVASDKQLDQREDAAELEQAAFNLRLQDQEYSANLDRIAKEQGMEDSIAFQESMTRTMLGENLDSTLKKMNFDEIQGNARRASTWEQALQNIAHAEKINNARMADAKKAAVIGGIMDLGKAGVSAYMSGQDASSAANDSVSQSPTEYSGPATQGQASSVYSARNP